MSEDAEYTPAKPTGDGWSTASSSPHRSTGSPSSDSVYGACDDPFNNYEEKSDFGNHRISPPISQSSADGDEFDSFKIVAASGGANSIAPSIASISSEGSEFEGCNSMLSSAGSTAVITAQARQQGIHTRRLSKSASSEGSEFEGYNAMVSTSERLPQPLASSEKEVSRAFFSLRNVPSEDEITSAPAQPTGSKKSGIDKEKKIKDLEEERNIPDNELGKGNSKPWWAEKVRPSSEVKRESFLRREFPSTSPPSGDTESSAPAGEGTVRTAGSPPERRRDDGAVAQDAGGSNNFDPLSPDMLEEPTRVVAGVGREGGIAGGPSSGTSNVTASPARKSMNVRDRISVFEKLSSKGEKKTVRLQIKIVYLSISWRDA